MKHFEVELEAKVSEVRRQYEVVYGQYKLMMIAKKKFWESYNEPILSDQVSAICRSMEEVYILKDELKTESKEIYDKLMAPGPDKKSLREQYTKVHEDLVKIKEDIWVNNMICAHMTELHQKLFGASNILLYIPEIPSVSTRDTPKSNLPLYPSVLFSADHCILCDQQLLSTSIAHLVVECEQVTGHRIQSGLVPAIQKSRLRLLGRALDPGVENVYTWLRGGVLNGEADLDQRWLDGTVEHESMGTRHDNRALAARLADFLQVAYRQYQSTLWKYHLESPCGSCAN
ncbi:hypothetical protein BASA50_002517 [Batrachochytrium salamandrivorans]|uniref:Uncharacterized protein n=1 Tax=Batrachochytrium salamandrivorans TaxID=1357716 RepID=A0ABQ8FP21_9FUNG|nr:hypothetical protein BASA50_002517 [Batrachochytrium salamandrivorans]